MSDCVAYVGLIVASNVVLIATFVCFRTSEFLRLSVDLASERERNARLLRENDRLAAHDTFINLLAAENEQLKKDYKDLLERCMSMQHAHEMVRMRTENFISHIIKWRRIIARASESDGR